MALHLCGGCLALLRMSNVENLSSVGMTEPKKGGGYISRLRRSWYARRLTNSYVLRTDKLALAVAHEGNTKLAVEPVKLLF